MNAKQALKAASKHIEELENFNARATADIKAYNKCIDGMIAGKSPCDWCEDHATGECDKPEHGGKGCDEWMLMWEHGEKGDEGNNAGTDGEGIPEASDGSGEGLKNIEGATGTL